MITAESLFFYSVGLYFYNAIHVLTRAFYGMKNSKDPVKFSIISIVINIVLNMLLIKPMAYKGLALATSVAAIVNFSLLLYTFKKKYIDFKMRRTIIFAIKVIVSSLIAVAVSFGIGNLILKLIVYTFKKKYIDFKMRRTIIFAIKVIVSSLIAVAVSFGIGNLILKLIVFSIVYIVLWAYPIYKKRLEVF